MVTANDMLKRLKDADAKFESDVESILHTLKDEIFDLNRGQLFYGKGTGGRLLGVYSKATESITAGKQGTGFPKRAGSPFNFYDTGDLFKSFALRGNWESFTIFNTSMSLKEFSMAKGIREDRIIGLTVENERFVNYDLILPLLREYFRNNIKS